MVIPAPSARRTIMTLYSLPLCVRSHGCRIVLFEKEVECQIQYVETETDQQELSEVTPYGETPALLDRDLVLFNAEIINEYLDERLPHPPLMPVDPVSRGKARLLSYRITRDWVKPIQEIKPGGKKLEPAVRQIIRDGLLAMSPHFKEQPFMLGEEHSLVDCTIAPLLWRLPMLGISLPRQAQPLLEYAERLFSRQSFNQSMSEQERELR